MTGNVDTGDDFLYQDGHVRNGGMLMRNVKRSESAGVPDRYRND